MAVRLEALLERVRDFDIKLIGGKKGMGHPVRWVHMVENVEIANFLEGDEIAFTTGIGLDTQEDLLELVKGTYENHASGMVVNIGPYIHQISPAVIAFCDAHDFPLFKAPWNVHMAEIMRTFCFMITESDKNNMELGVALKNAIFCPNQEELYLDYMERNGFLKSWNYCVSAIGFYDRETKKRLEDRRIEALKRPVENLITHKGWRAAVLVLEHRMILVFGKYSEKRVEKMMAEIWTTCKRFMGENETVYRACGKVTKSARCIGKSYQQAIKLEKLQVKRGREEELTFYGRMGLYKLLLAVEDMDIVKEYYNETIAPLEEYDHLNQTDCTVVLKTYLGHSGRVKETAEELFVHRNTVNYKLNKIESILGVDLSDFMVRQRLMVGFMTEEIMD